MASGFDSSQSIFWDQEAPLEYSRMLHYLKKFQSRRPRLDHAYQGNGWDDKSMDKIFGSRVGVMVSQFRIRG